MNEQFENFISRFDKLSDDELVEAFNHEVGNEGWTSSRADYLAALQRQFEKRGWDYSAIGDDYSLSFSRLIRVKNGKVEIV